MKESPSLQEFTKKIYGAMETGEVDKVAVMMSDHPGLLVIGSDPKEWWKGKDKIIEIFAVQFEEMKGMKLVSSQPEAYEYENTGWVADQATFRVGDEIDVEFRFTLVCIKEGDEWKIVQWHVSLGVLNEEVLGQELST